MQHPRKTKRRCCGDKGVLLKKVSLLSGLFLCEKCGRTYHDLA